MGATAASRASSPSHTEGCGFAGDNVYQLLQRTYSGYVRHPGVATALFLEHGCEKIPNDIVRHYLTEQGVDPERYGWASVQLDGGIEKVLAKVEAWFAARVASLPAAQRAPAGLEALSLGLLADGPVAASTAEALGGLAQMIVGAGGSVLLPATSPLLSAPAFLARTLGSAPVRSTLAYGQPLAKPGFHVIETESEHWVENLTGLGGCGAQIVLGVVHGQARQGHPFVPVLQMAETGTGPAPEDVDGFLRGNAEQDLADGARARARGRRRRAPAGRLGPADGGLSVHPRASWASRPEGFQASTASVAASKRCAPANSNSTRAPWPSAEAERRPAPGRQRKSAGRSAGGHAPPRRSARKFPPALGRGRPRAHRADVLRPHAQDERLRAPVRPAAAEGGRRVRSAGPRAVPSVSTNSARPPSARRTPAEEKFIGGVPMKPATTKRLRGF